MGAQIAVLIPDDAWENGDFDDDAPAGHRLKVTLVINGTTHHLEAHLVVPDADPQRAYADDDALGRIHDAVARGNGPWQTTTIRGRRYVLVATPHC